MNNKRASVNSGGIMECDWTVSFELQGEERKRALKNCLKILKEWDIKMPPVQPLEVSAPCKPGDCFFDNKEIGRKGII